MFKASFRPRTYLNEYYSEVDLCWDPHSASKLSSVGQENSSLLVFYAQLVVPAVQESGCQRLLEVGVGPTIYQLISLAPVLDTILVTDLIADNLQLLREWEYPDFWHRFIAAALHYETGEMPNEDAIRKRKELIQQKLRFAAYDVISDSWLEGYSSAADFDVVIANFCAESITSDKSVWRVAMDHICAKVSARGLLALTALQNCRRYKVGCDHLPATPIVPADIKEVLAAHQFKSVQCFVREISRREADYDGFIFVLARRGE